jgi:hypothetical protein
VGIIKLAEKARANGDSSSLRVGVEESLEQALKEIRENSLKPLRSVICLQYADDEGPDYFTANCTFIEALGLLEFVKLAIDVNQRGHLR